MNLYTQCWKCGAPTTEGRTVCYMYCKGRRPNKQEAEELAAELYVHSHFHDGEPNPTAELMRAGAETIRSLLRTDADQA